MRREMLYRVVLLIFIVIVVIFLTAVFLLNREYRLPRVIQLTGIDYKEFRLDIPVESLKERPAGDFQTFPLQDRIGKNYVLRWNPESDALYITLTRWEFGGWIVMHGAYRIPDADLRHKLQTFLESQRKMSGDVEVSSSPDKVIR